MPSPAPKPTPSLATPAPGVIFALSAHTAAGASSRTFGWFPDEETALMEARTNRGGLDEALYDWLCLESIKPGVHGPGTVLQWYRWFHPDGQEGAWVEAEDGPAWAGNSVNFAMG